MSKTYFDLLKDPRWQKKRLQIMKRDKFACKLCGDNTSTLNVHHKEYINGKSPWEYKNETLITLCEDCHYVIEINVESRKYFHSNLLRALSIKNKHSLIKLYQYPGSNILVRQYWQDQPLYTFIIDKDQSKEMGEFLIKEI